MDTGLASTYFSEADQLVMPPSGSPNSLSQTSSTTPQRPTRRYKTQLRDFLSTCRSKRKLQQAQPPQHQSNSNMGQVCLKNVHSPAKCRQNNFDCEFQITPPAPVVDYIPDPAAVAAAYTNLNPMYATSPYPSSADNLYMTPTVHSSNFYPVTENLYHQYRLQGVSGYYPSDYHHSSVPTSYVANGFLPYDGYISTKEEKWQDSGKYYPGHDVTSRSMYSEYSSPTGHSQV